MKRCTPLVAGVNNDATKGIGSGNVAVDTGSPTPVPNVMSVAKHTERLLWRRVWCLNLLEIETRDPSDVRTRIAARLLCFLLGLGCEKVSVTMDQFPLVTFAAKHLGHTYFHGDGFRFAAHANGRLLKPNPIGYASTRTHLQYLEVTVAAWLELLCPAFVSR